MGKFMRLKKFLMMAVFAFGLAGLTATADAACTPKPGCSCKFLDAADHHADANRVRDKSYQRQMNKQPENTVGMTCYDHELALSSRLGQIFSDTYAGTSFGGANTDVFGPVYDSSSGVGQNTETGKNKALGQQYAVVIDKEMQDHAKRFVDSLSAFLGATILNFLGPFLSALNGAFSAITSGIAAIDSAITTFMNDLNTLQGFLDQLGAALPGAVVAIVATVKMWWDTIKGVVLDAIHSAQAAISAGVSMLSGLVQGLLGSLFNGAATPGSDPCARIKRLWNPKSISMQALIGAFKPMEGGGIDGYGTSGYAGQGTPYFDFNSLISGTVKSALGTTFSLTDGQLFKTELNNATNSPLLNKAMTDLTSGVLSAQKPPGAGEIWLQVPSFGATPTVAAIIGQM